MSMPTQGSIGEMNADIDVSAGGFRLGLFRDCVARDVTAARPLPVPKKRKGRGHSPAIRSSVP